MLAKEIDTDAMKPTGLTLPSGSALADTYTHKHTHTLISILRSRSLEEQGATRMLKKIKDGFE